MSDFKEKVLNILNIKEDNLPFLLKEYSFSDIENPDNFLNMEKVSKKIKDAINLNKKIMVYGDYDCDGISATAILVKMFQYLNYKVGYYIPSRYIDGYGINLPRAKQIVDKNYDLVITVDNGINALEPIEYLLDNGVEVIVTDHHEIMNSLPKTEYIVHPDLKTNQEIIKQCGAYLAFMISIKVLGKIDTYLLSLATLATISDMMPLISYNRVLVKIGLDIINCNHNFPYWNLISNQEIVDEETLGYIICPKINAFGRIKEDLSVNDMVRFLVSPDIKDIKNIALEIEKVNAYRKDLLKEYSNKSVESIDPNKDVIVYRNDEMSEGIIGLIAAKFINDYHHPSFVFTKCKDGLVKASARSLKGFNLAKALEELSNYLLFYGGHEQAAGFSLKEENYNDFVIALENYAKNQTIEKEEDHFAMLSFNEFNYENYMFIKSLSPFGVDFPKPDFGIELSANKVYLIGNNNQHIRGKLNPLASFIGFNLSDKIKDKNSFVAIGNIEYDTFRKANNISFKIKKVI